MFNQYKYKSMQSIDRTMKRLEDRVENVNNAFTHGYKTKRVTFHDTIRGIKEDDSREFVDGTSVKTNNQFDFALEGPGFFEIMMEDGTLAYTRSGKFKVSPNGQLVTPEGYYLMLGMDTRKANKVEKAGEDQYNFDTSITAGEIIIPTGAEVHIGPKGELMTNDGNFIGKLSIVTFPNEQGLEHVGTGTYIATDNAGFPEPVNMGVFEGQTHIRQGYLENSNVNIVKEMSEMNQLNTHMKSQMKVIKMLDQLQDSLNQTITRNI